MAAILYRGKAGRRSAFAEVPDWIDAGGATGWQKACQRGGKQKHRSDDGEDGWIPQAALRPGTNGLAKADAEQDTEDESHACGARGGGEREECNLQLKTPEHSAPGFSVCECGLEVIGDAANRVVFFDRQDGMHGAQAEFVAHGQKSQALQESDALFVGVCDGAEFRTVVAGPAGA